MAWSVLFVIHRAQPLQEDTAVVLLLAGVGAVGVGSQVHHLLVNLRSLIVAGQYVQHKPFVIAGFKRRGVHLARFANGGQRILILSLAALNFTNMDQSLRVLGIGLGKRFELFERLVELVVVEQRLPKGVQRARVSWVHVGGALIGGDGVLGLLQLVIGRAQGKLHLGAAVGHWNGLNHLGCMGDVAALGVEAGQIENHFL